LSEFIKNRVIPKELSSYQPGLSTLQLDKKHLQKRRIFRRDREPSRIPARTQERLSNKSRKVTEFVYECICSSALRKTL